LALLCTGFLLKEDGRTFEFILDFLVTLCSYLATKKFVLLVDGDRALWLAARIRFLCVIIILCAYHASENFRKRLGPMITSFRIKRKARDLAIANAANVESTATAASVESCKDTPAEDHEETVICRWVQCIMCNRYRRIPHEVTPPSAYECSETFWDRSITSCQDPQDTSFVVDEEVDSEISQNPIDELKKPITPMRWYTVWLWLRDSETLTILRQRLDQLLEVYTSDAAVNYVKFLWSIAPH
jgi:hypothetical protein